MSKLILARHGETEYNAAGRWTGLTDTTLTERGQEEAQEAGRYLAENVDVIHAVYYSMLRRTFSTVVGILGEAACCPSVEIEAHAALNERDYGVFTGKNKAAVREEYGESIFMAIRRGWDYKIEDGETLADVSDRVIPFHEDHVVPRLADSQNVLVVSSNNTLRAYVKHLEGISADEVSTLELGTAEIRSYSLDNQLNISSIDSRAIGDVH